MNNDDTRLLYDPAITLTPFNVVNVLGPARVGVDCRLQTTP